ncbi:hypothetical protein psyc5s11_15630 [Clostridium gelidum]|uniref:Uncharacterized protein n=1 Tax=Clostridium gelidum TaxID=704125 RepID=A0ABN6IXN5_9CLOT|nr:hypothetical protein [Clostridium gelidum]BCZ45496.1 hypothetical protein psyc5s11_15630 [Clostridium gelidum]
MSENSVKVEYSIKRIRNIFLSIFFLIILGVFVIFFQPMSIKSICVVISVIMFIFLITKFELNKIKKISFYDGKLSIDRFLLSSLTFESKDIRSISKDELKIGNKLFSLKFVINKSELITFLLNAMNIKNTDEEINMIFTGGRIFKNKEEMDKTNKQIDKANKRGNVIQILTGIGFFALLILNHCPIIILISFVIIIGVAYLKYTVLEKRINNINSKFLRRILNYICYLVGLALTVVLGIVIYTIFKSWNIDLLKITV